jgi:hypothetical protein
LKTFRAAEFPVRASQKSPAALAFGPTTVIGSAPNAMGKFDSRNSQKMSRRKGQAKKKARLQRRAEAARASRTQKKPAGKKKSAASSAASSG